MFINCRHDGGVVAQFTKCEGPLRALWQYYSAVSRGGDEGNSNAAAGGAGIGVNQKAFLELYADFDINPTFITKRELKAIFAAASAAHARAVARAVAMATGTPAPLSYAAFVEALGRSALVALAKPAFQHLYPTAADKVEVLLGMWGVGDIYKLKEIHARQAVHLKASGAAEALAAAAGAGAGACVSYVLSFDC
jgi:hypothetical protein